MTENPYRIELGLGQAKSTGLWHPRLRLVDPEGRAVYTAHDARGCKTRIEAMDRLRASLPHLLEKLKAVGNDVEVLEVV